MSTLVLSGQPSVFEVAKVATVVCVRSSALLQVIQGLARSIIVSNTTITTLWTWLDFASTQSEFQLS